MLCLAMVIFALGETVLQPVGSALVNEIAPRTPPRPLQRRGWTLVVNLGHPRAGHHRALLQRAPRKLVAALVPALLL